MVAKPSLKNVVSSSGVATYYDPFFGLIFVGNDEANVIVGTSLPDIIIGGLGDDTMIGGDGSDVYFVDSTGDVVQEESGNGDDMVFTSVSYTLGENVESLVLYGSESINGTGNAGDNLIAGNSGANTIFGAGGSDLLLGGGGNDSLYGDEGNDLLYGNEGNDRLSGGTGVDSMAGGIGNDTYVVDSSDDVVFEADGEGAADKVFSYANYTLSDNVELLELVGTSNISGTGNALDNRISGNGAGNLISGEGGADGLFGNGGNDTLIGDEGNDQLRGGADNDKLVGGLANDLLYGGTGADLFVYESATDSGIGRFQRDVVYDFNAAEGDKLDFSAFDGASFLGLNAAFTGEGPDIIYGYDGLGNTIVSFDADGNGAKDFEVQLVGTHALTGGNFVL